MCLLFFFGPYAHLSSKNNGALQLGNELRKSLMPYIALDFNQNVCKDRLEVAATISESQSLATYGGPYTQFSFVCGACSLSQFRWVRLTEEKENEMVQFTS